MVTTRGSHIRNWLEEEQRLALLEENKAPEKSESGK